MMTEFGLIAAIRELAKELPDHSFEGIGDDCAVLPIGGGEALCYTTDLMVEGIHFLRAKMRPEEVAHKALHVNLSDVAAMGIRPTATLLSVALPREAIQSEWVERFMQGYIAASKQAGVALIGGDTTASLRDITISVTAIGRGPVDHLKHRRDAQCGDMVCVTAPLGGPALGLRDLLAGHSESAAAERHKCPEAELACGEWLGAERAVHAMMDISDGIASDLRHILEASGCDGEVWLEQVPRFEGASCDDALEGGEEYHLLLTVAADNFDEVAARFEAHFGHPLYPIGRIGAKSATPTLRWLENGAPCAGSWQGFRHY